MIPEAGHGAVVYQPCVAEMGVAFIDDPARKFDNSCAESIEIEWHVPEWAKTSQTAGALERYETVIITKR